jgi:hypothetical protein
LKSTTFITLSLSVILVICSCTSKSEQSSLKEIVDDFAQLECRAIALREQRFALANQIRFTQDTLLHASANSDTARLNAKLKALNVEREHTTQRSLVLADSIKQRLDSLMSKYLTKVDDKEQFNQMLHAALENMHCKDRL